MSVRQTISTPDLADENQEAVKALELQFINYGGVQAFFGQAVTIKCFEDNSLVKTVIGSPGAGRVIVVDGGSSLRRALLGDIQAARAVDNGWAGLIINGAIRDIDQIAELNLGVQALGTHPFRTEKLGTGQRDIAIHFGGVSIEPGDWIYADNNGVLVAAHELNLGQS